MLVGNRDVALNRLDGHRKSLAVQITNRDGDTNEKRNAPAHFHRGIGGATVALWPLKSTKRRRSFDSHDLNE